MNIQSLRFLLGVRFLTFFCFFSFITSTFSQQTGFILAKNFLAIESTQETIENQTTYTSSKSLIEDLHPSVYLENGIVKMYGSNPKCLFVDTVSNLINVSNSFTKDYIEIVTIKIHTVSELSQPIDLSIFYEYPALRIIYVVVPFECTENQLNSFIQNQTTNYHLVYTIVNPS